MKREKEFKEYLKNKRIDLTSCIKKYNDCNRRIAEVLEVLDEELGMSYQEASNVIDGNIETLIIQIMNRENDTETIDYDTFVEKYREYDKEYEPEHYIKDENGNMVHVELVSVKAGKNMIITWKDTETGKMFQTIE
jgi:sugar-specific transcriptional regulator TrmB